MGHANTLVRRARPWLGTIAVIALPAGLETAYEAGFAELARIHRLMSFHETASDLGRLRAAPPNEPVELDPDTIAVLRIAAELHRDTDGLFNIAIARQLVRDRFLPRMNIAHLSRFGGNADDIEILDDRHVRLHRRTLIDLGGIAKGYAVDCAVAALQAAGVDRGIVNAGGDLRVFGKATVPVEVRMAPGAYSAAFALANGAIASSENTRTRRSSRGHPATPHIGRDGRCIAIDEAVTVMASSCVIADAMTKVAMVDPDLADRLLAKHDGQVVRFEHDEVA
jgi:thiamine biosynthesis lipoprotein